MRKRVMPSSYVRSEKLHPCFISTSRIKIRPIPWPLGLVEKKGVNNLVSTSLEMPRPVSATSSMTGEVETKLFTPFFSTKPNGQGIGLIFIREVLMKHGCSFSLRTYEDGITRFRIMFP